MVGIKDFINQYPINYCYLCSWMLKNFSLLGATGRRVVVGGDSAGSNLAIGLTLQCIQVMKAIKIINIMRLIN